MSTINKNRYELRSKIVRATPILIALIIFSLSSAIWISDVKEKQENLIYQTNNLSDELSFHIYNQINNRINLVYLLTAQWNSTSNLDELYNKTRYENMVSSYYNFYPGILAINWIDNDGIIRWVYPYEMNQRVINQSIIYLANGQLNTGFNYTNQTKNFGTSQIAPMYQGGKGFATYMPIIYNDTQTGFFNMVFRTDDFFPSILQNIPILNDYSFELNESTTQIYHHNENFTIDNDYAKSSTIRFSNREWVLILCPNEALRNDVTYWNNIGIFIMGSLLTVIAVIFAQLLQKQIFETEKIYKEKEATEKSLIQSQKLDALGTLAGGIAHDMNNILMGLQSSLFFIENGSNLSENVIKSNQDAINDMNELLKRGIDLMRQILDFSRKTDAKLMPVNINDILISSIKIFKNSIDKRIHLETQIPKEKYIIKGDIARIHQICLNIFINSRDAMPNGGNLLISLERVHNFQISNFINKPNVLVLKPSLGDSIEIIPNFSFDSAIIISIKDTGEGIPSDKLHHIFDPFYTTKTRGKGTGLGLATVYQAVKVMDGIIVVESEFNKGTEFKLIFSEEKIIESSQVTENTVSSLEQPLNLNILLIEDEDVIRKSFITFFNQIGSNIICFEESGSGLEHYILHHELFDLVILDINLPKLSGIEVYRRIKEVCPSQQTLFITGYTEYEIPPRDEFDLGIIQKPFKFNELIKIIKNGIR